MAEAGLFVDDVTVKAGSETVLSDGAEEGGPAWTFDGFSIVGATTNELYDNYYIAGHRSYVSYDKYLTTGPYNFGFLNTKPDYAEHYKYGHGLLISYWDTSVNDNNTNVHPGTGRNLIIDANPAPITNIVTGAPWRARIQMYDAPFSLHKADSMTLHTNGKPSYIRGQAAKPLFDDTKKYWYAELPQPRSEAAGSRCQDPGPEGEGNRHEGQVQLDLHQIVVTERPVRAPERSLSHRPGGDGRRRPAAVPLRGRSR
ncbi:hypothetical protein [Aeromicrobium sp. UC242_57]|uniref:hypothetical protein n=1 Tax=Aeromicrobium sp. UC242_57 TaxID=3374624 RepID=UPI003797306C